ncbi:MAG: hypothetical protein JSR33_09340, partial [Proteobacteria bacterium]|nr:hypothetical protein [Pseudomonadota bacterium]
MRRYADLAESANNEKNKKDRFNSAIYQAAVDAVIQLRIIFQGYQEEQARNNFRKPSSKETVVLSYPQQQ